MLELKFTHFSKRASWCHWNTLVNDCTCPIEIIGNVTLYIKLAFRMPMSGHNSIDLSHALFGHYKKWAERTHNKSMWYSKYTVITKQWSTLILTADPVTLIRSGILSGASQKKSIWECCTNIYEVNHIMNMSAIQFDPRYPNWYSPYVPVVISYCYSCSVAIYSRWPKILSGLSGQQESQLL